MSPRSPSAFENRLLANEAPAIPQSSSAQPVAFRTRRRERRAKVIIDFEDSRGRGRSESSPLCPLVAVDGLLQVRRVLGD